MLATTGMRLVLHPHNLNNNYNNNENTITIREQQVGGIQTQPETWKKRL